MKHVPVMNIVAPRARPTLVGALWLATIISLPVGLIGFGIDLALGLLN